jgi:hypothetical protein
MEDPLDGGDARKGQEKGKASDVCRMRNVALPKFLKPRYLIDAASRVCATDPLVLPRGAWKNRRKREGCGKQAALESYCTEKWQVAKGSTTVQAAPTAVKCYWV